MTIGEGVRTARIKKGYTQEELAKRLGYQSRSSVNKIEAGRDIPRAMLGKLAEVLDVSPAYLMGWDSAPTSDSPTSAQLSAHDSNISPIRLKRFPLLGKIACGKPLFATDNPESYVMADMDIQADFCLRANGDSMTGARIHDGDIVFIREMPMVENGDIAAVMIDNEATLKRVFYYPETGKLILNPENPAFEPLVYIGEELNDIRILGKAVYLMSAL